MENELKKEDEKDLRKEELVAGEDTLSDEMQEEVSGGSLCIQGCKTGTEDSTIRNKDLR